jgi:hypothetical protein
MDNIETLDTTREQSSRMRKSMKNEGWMSAHYWIRHSIFSADRLRSLAKKGVIRAKILCTDGGMTTWYYHSSDVANITKTA